MLSTTGSSSMKKLQADIAKSALLRELRNSKVNLRRANESVAGPSSTRKKRRQQQETDGISALGGGGAERKVRCLRNSKIFSGDELLNTASSSNTFLNLSPPSSSLGDDSLNFTFGRRHYTAIQLSGFASSSCACGSSTSSKFDIFSSYRCACKKQTKKATSLFSDSRKSRSNGDVWA